MDMERWADGAHEIRRLIEDGQNELSSRLVNARLLTPLLTVIDTAGMERANRWLTLAEAMRETGWSRKYFEKPQHSLEGRSRLQLWKEEGSAEQTDEGIWLISPRRLPPKKAASRPTLRGPDAGSDATALADELFH